MFYKRRELRRLWDVEVYNGDPEDPNVTTHIETVVAFNAVEANRKCGGRVALPPTARCYVTWPVDPNTTGPIYRIDSTAGPSDELIEPTIGLEASKP